MLYITESLLYISFACLMGYFILSMVPIQYKPTIAVPHRLVLIWILAIPICSFFPLHQLAIENAAAFNMSYFDMLRSIVLDFNIGEAFLWTLLGSAGLAVMVGAPAFRKDRHMPKVALALTVLLTVWLGYASHAASLSPFGGLVAHAGHFLAIIIWLGILFIVGWFSKDDKHWLAFLKWFSPLAIVCVLITLLAGLILMNFTTINYINGFMLPYGQWLLLKHISIIPLLWLAFSNGFLYKKQAKKLETFKPLPFVRIESLFAVIVLVFTAMMGQQAPPHDVTSTLRYVSPSKLFTTIFSGSFSPDLQLTMQLGLDSILLFIAAVLMLYAALVAFTARKVILLVISLLLFIAFTYGGIMFSVVAL